MKMLNVKLKLIVILSVICFYSQAQTYYAGQAMPGYVDINPDTILLHPLIEGSETYYFDLNNDSLNDFSLESYFTYSPGGTWLHIDIKPLNPNSYSLLGRVDSLYHTWAQYWMVTKVAKPLMLGDSINAANAIWDNTELSLTNRTGFAGTYLTIQDFVSTNDLYIGIKYEDTTDTNFGWIRVNCMDEIRLTIKDYSTSASFIGINEIQESNFSTYPNPSHDKLYFKTDKNFDANIVLYNVTGKVIFSKKQNTSESIDVLDISEGVYFLRVENKLLHTIVNKKLVVIK